MACTPTDLTPNPDNGPKEFVDYVSQLKLDLNSDTAKIIDAKVRTQSGVAIGYIDGDTTHFSIDPSNKYYSTFAQGVLKARYLAVNTPESTGVIEDYGKKAAAFTRSKLESAQSIVVESDTSTWNADSTGSRYTVWIWYRTSADSDYRNLNLEILQEGLALASGTGSNRYGEICLKALAQARENKLYVFSGVADPDTYHGKAIEMTLKQLRINAETYKGVIVAFEGVVTRVDGETVFVQEYDAETGLYYGIQVFMGYNSGTVRDIMTTVGNRVRVVGSMQYYEAGGTYQIADVRYRDMKPNDPRNVQLISQNNKIVNTTWTVEDFYATRNVEVSEDETKSFATSALIMNTLVTMENLTVNSFSTTNNVGDSDGAITLSCTNANGEKISVRTTVLYNTDGIVTGDMFKGKTITVTGIVDYFSTSGKYQVKVFALSDIVVAA